MRVPLSWLTEYVDLPDGTTPQEVADRLTMLGLKLERLHEEGVSGPFVVGRVLSVEPEQHTNGKTINWCRVDVGPGHNEPGEGDQPPGRGIVCGAHNFGPGDLVAVALPGSVLPGDFAITARKTYGHVSDGMICSTRELAIGDDHDGILVLDDGAADPGDDAAALLELNDTVLELEVATDRGYALSLRGVARDTALAFGTAFRDPADVALADTDGPGYPVKVEDAEGCPVFAARTVSGLDPAAPSPAWLARRVRMAGMRPTSLAVDVTNYVMLELGQPIHGYDRDRLQGPIVVRRARPDERLTTLDGTPRTLDQEDLLITDDRGPIGLAGVMGGATTELHDGTTDVVVEAACFDGVTIGRTARRHRLPSEASKRFERGVDPQLAVVAAQRVADLLVELGGASHEPGVTLVGTATGHEAVVLDPALVARLTGVEVPRGRVVDILEQHGCTVTDRGTDRGAGLAVVPPTWRPDLTGPYDLVEEVIRVVGYDTVPSVLPVAPAGRGLTLSQRLRRRIGFGLAGAGLTEVKTYPFVGEQAWERLQLPADDDRRRAVRLANPISDEEPLLATTLLPGLLATARRNLGRGHGDLALFELAPVFHPSPGAGPAPILPVDRRPGEDEWRSLEAAIPEQPRHLAAVLTGRRSPDGWWGEGVPAGWADAIALVREVARLVRVDVAVEPVRYAPWHPGRCARVLAGTGEEQVVIGHAGEVHPRTATAYGLPDRTAAVEIDLDALLARAAEIVSAPAFSTYPVAKEDVALVVDAKVSAAALAETLQEGAGDLLESVRLFDLYTGDQIGAGKKSMAFALRFRATDRTLTEAETGRARDAAVALAAERWGAVQRS